MVEDNQHHRGRYLRAALGLRERQVAVVAVVRAGRVVHARGFGVRVRGRPEPVTPDTLMMVGSTTKAMSTMMMAALVDEGRLRWDQPVFEMLPGFRLADPETTRHLTVLDLVYVCTGVQRRDAALLFNAGSLTAWDNVATLAGFRLFTGFGEAFQYSNQMVDTSGARGADLDEGYVAQSQARLRRYWHARDRLLLRPRAAHVLPHQAPESDAGRPRGATAFGCGGYRAAHRHGRRGVVDRQ